MEGAGEAQQGPRDCQRDLDIMSYQTDPVPGPCQTETWLYHVLWISWVLVTGTWDLLSGIPLGRSLGRSILEATSRKASYGGKPKNLCQQPNCHEVFVKATVTAALFLKPPALFPKISQEGRLHATSGASFSPAWKMIPCN